MMNPHFQDTWGGRAKHGAAQQTTEPNASGLSSDDEGHGDGGVMLLAGGSACCCVLTLHVVTYRHLHRGRWPQEESCVK